MVVPMVQYGGTNVINMQPMVQYGGPNHKNNGGPNYYKIVAPTIKTQVAPTILKMVVPTQGFSHRMEKQLNLWCVER